MVAPAGGSLGWSAPPECPDAGVVDGWVEAYAAQDGATHSVQADGTVTRAGEGYVLTLVVEDGTRQARRTFAHADCEALARAAALVVAVAADPVAVASRVRVEAPGVVPEVAAAPAGEGDPARGEAAASPPADPEDARGPGERQGPGETLGPREVRDSPPASPPEPVPAARDTGETAASSGRVPRGGGLRSRRGTGLRLGVRPEVSLGLGVLPGIAGIGVGGVVALLGRAAWRVEAGGAYWASRTALADDSDRDAGGRLFMGAGAVRGCWAPAFGRVALPICGGLELGGVVGRGFGDGIASQRESDLWLGLPAGLGVAWAPLRWLALVGRVEAVIGLRRPGFHLDGVGEVHRAGAVGARTALGVEVRFF